MTHELGTDANDTDQVEFEISDVIPFLAGESQQFVGVAEVDPDIESDVDSALRWWAVDSLDEIPAGNREFRRNFSQSALTPFLIQRACLVGLRQALSVHGQEAAEAEQSGLAIGNFSTSPVHGVAPAVSHNDYLEAGNVSQVAYDQLERVSTSAILIAIGVQANVVPRLVADTEGNPEQEHDFMRLYSQPNHGMTGPVLGQYRLLCSALELADATAAEGPGFLSTLEHRLESGDFDGQLIEYKLRNGPGSNGESTPVQQQAQFLRTVLGSLGLDGRIDTDDKIIQAITDNMASLPQNVKTELAMERKLLLDGFRQRRQAIRNFMASRWLTTEIGKLNEVIVSVDDRINEMLITKGFASRRLDPELTPGLKKRRDPGRLADREALPLPSEPAKQAEDANISTIAEVVYSARGLPTTETLEEFLRDPARSTGKPTYEETVLSALQRIAVNYGTGNRNSGIKRLEDTNGLFEFKAGEAAGFRAPSWLRQYRIIFRVEEGDANEDEPAKVCLVDVVGRRDLRTWIKNNFNR
jgi:hypothetical protein